MRLIIAAILVCAFSALVSAQSAKTAEDFTSVSLSGRTVELSSLKGKVVLLTFWSTRCAICHSEIPRLNKLAAGYANSDVVFLAATMENEGKVESYLKNNPFNFDILPNSFGLLIKYAQKDKNGNLNMGFPAYFLIDKTGQVAIRANGWDRIGGIDSAIGRLLSQ